MVTRGENRVARRREAWANLARNGLQRVCSSWTLFSTCFPTALERIAIQPWNPANSRTPWAWPPTENYVPSLPQIWFVREEASPSCPERNLFPPGVNSINVPFFTFLVTGVHFLAVRVMLLLAWLLSLLCTVGESQNALSVLWWKSLRTFTYLSSSYVITTTFRYDLKRQRYCATKCNDNCNTAVVYSSRDVVMWTLFPAHGVVGFFSTPSFFFT